MNTPIANAESLQIGSVDFVSPDEIKVVLDLDAPNDVALNSGVPRPFPRINSYVLIAGEGGYLVSQIEWITIERSQFPKRRGMQDFGILDLPYPLRKMNVIPLGQRAGGIFQTGDLKEKRCFTSGHDLIHRPALAGVFLVAQDDIRC